MVASSRSSMTAGAGSGAVVESDADNQGASASLCIPITSSTSSDEHLFVEVFADELADTSANTLLQVLKDEKADAKVYGDAGLLYMQQHLARESLLLLQEACDQLLSSGVASANATVQDRVRLLACTGIAYLASASSSLLKSSGGSLGKTNDALDESRQQADLKFTQAGKVDTVFPITWMGRGMLNLALEKHDVARFFFQTTLDQCGPVLPALLGMGAVMYGQGQYREALQQYDKAIRTYPQQSGAPARVGLGMCCYQLGQVDRAKAAFTRALTMDKENVPAIVGAAVLDMAAADESLDARDAAQRTERAMKLLGMANLLQSRGQGVGLGGGSSSMVQNHLANHYFHKWTPVTGTVTMEQGSNIVQGSQQQSLPLEAGELIRIGTGFETTVVEEDMDDEDEDNDESAGKKFKLAHTWKEPSATGLKIWKKDYDRVVALAKGAYSSTGVKEIQAESLFNLGRVQHVREEENVLKFYERACKLAPDLTPARFGLAKALIMKEDYNEGMAELEKVLKACPLATDAMSLMGLLKVYMGKEVEEGLTLLRKATERDPLNPDLVILEAQGLQQHRSNYDKAFERYQKAIELIRRKNKGTNNQVPYDVLVNTAVLCHETKRFDQGLQLYQQALISLDDAGTARTETSETGGSGGGIRHVDNAIFCTFVDSDLKVEPVEVDGASFLKVLDVAESDIQSLNVVTGDHVKLQEDFQSEIKAITSKDGSVFIELTEAFVPMETSDDDGTPPIPLFVMRENKLLDLPEAMTIAFNLACLHQAMGRTTAAIELHKAILKRNPIYVNSYLRLACIAVDSGALKECSEWLKLAASSAPGNAEVLVLVGNLHLSLCDWIPAQNVFDGLLANKVPGVDAYASLSLGNIYFANLVVPNKPDRYSRHLQYATDYYRRILTKDPSNAYAANGLGTVFAEKADIFKAKETFNRVREVSGDSIPDALLNLGHIFLAQKKHAEALQMYKRYRERAEDTTTPVTSKSRVDDVVDVLLYIAFAYFDWARHTELFNDANAAPADGRYKEAMDHLELAISKHTKKEVVLTYNLCMVRLHAANCVLQKLTRNIPRTVAEVKDALTGLEESLVTVEKILEEKQDPEKKIPIPTSTMQDFVKHCRANIASATSHLKDEEKRAAEMEVERQVRALEAEEALKKEELRKLELKEEEAKKQEERDRKAEAKMKQVEALRAGWQQEQDQKQAAKEKKAEKKAGVSEDPGVELEEQPQPPHGLFDDSDEDSDDEPEEKPDGDQPPSGEKKASSATKSDLFGSSDEDEDDAAQGKEAPAPADLFGDSDDDDDSGKEADKGDGEKDASKAAAAKTASNLFGDSDEDESDEDITRPGSKRSSDNDGGEKEQQPQKKRRVLEDDDEE